MHCAYFIERTDKIVVYFCSRSFGEIPGIVLSLFRRYFWSVFPLSIEDLFAYKDYKQSLCAK